MIGTEFVRIPSNDEAGYKVSADYIGTYQLLRQSGNTSTFRLRAYIDYRKWGTISSTFCEFRLMGKLIKEKKHDKYLAYAYRHGENLIGYIDYTIDHNEDGTFPKVETNGFAKSFHFAYSSAQIGQKDLYAPDIPKKPILKITSAENVGINIAQINFEITRKGDFAHLDYRLNGKEISGMPVPEETSFLISNLEPNKDYRVEIRGRGYGEKVVGDWSNPIYIKTKDYSRIISLEGDFVINDLSTLRINVNKSPNAQEHFLEIKSLDGKTLSSSKPFIDKVEIQEKEIDNFYNIISSDDTSVIVNFILKTKSNGIIYEDSKEKRVYLPPVLKEVKIDPLFKGIDKIGLSLIFSHSNRLAYIQSQVDEGAVILSSSTVPNVVLTNKELQNRENNPHRIKIRGVSEENGLKIYGNWLDILASTASPVEIIDAKDVQIELTKPFMKIKTNGIDRFYASISIEGIGEDIDWRYVYVSSDDEYAECSFDFSDKLIAQIYEVAKDKKDLGIKYKVITYGEYPYEIQNMTDKKIKFNPAGPVFNDFYIETIDNKTLQYAGLNKVIKNISDIKIYISGDNIAIPQKGSYIKSYTVYCGNMSKDIFPTTGEGATVIFPKVTGDEVAIAVADSKGRVTTVVKKLDIVPYQKPELTFLALERVNLSTPTVEVKLQGKYTENFPKISNTLSIGYKIKDDPHGFDPITDLFSLENGEISNFPNKRSELPVDFELKKKYTVEIEVADSLFTNYYVAEIQKASVLFSAKKGIGCALGGFFDHLLGEGTQIHNILYTLDLIKAKKGIDSSDYINVDKAHGYRANGQEVLAHNGKETILSNNGNIKIRPLGIKNAEKEVTISADGSLNAITIKQGNQTLLDLVYPIGSIYISMNNEDPGAKRWKGTTWERIGQGRALVGVGSPTANTHNKYGVPTPGYNIAQPGEQGGTDQVRLSIAQMPSHAHGGSTGRKDSSGKAIPDGGHNHVIPVVLSESAIAEGGKSEFQVLGTETEPNTLGTARNGQVIGGGEHIHNISYEGEDEYHSNMPPYLGVYMWRRIK